jgi:predicted LPLAT superfamily acyltransferase
MSREWIKQKERGSPFALRLILWIAQNLGRSVARAILYPITLYFLLMAKPQRNASFRYLSRVLGRQATLLDVAQHIHCFASTILDRVFQLADRSDEFDIQCNNPEEIYHLLDQGQGCLLLGAHLGSFEVLRSLAINKHKMPLKILMYPNHNEQISKIFMQLNPEVAQSILPLGETDTMLKVADALAEGKAVAMLGDRTVGSEKSVNCRFLGKTAQFPAGPMFLASVLKVPVIFFVGLHMGGNRYELYFEKLADQVVIDRKQRGVDLQRWMQVYVDRLEHYARKAPHNWFNFYDFWNEDA